MIRITIDNNTIYPENGGNFELHEANPLLTEAGTYSYDIDVSLSATPNKRAYAHLDRLNADTLPHDRTARIEDDGKILYIGTEQILEMNGEKLKVQIVSGKSELNLRGNKTRMLEIDLGEEPKPTPEQAMATLKGKYPQTRGVYCPIMTKFHHTPRPTNTKFANFIHQNTYDHKHYVDGTPFILQPYLLFILETLLSTLGWTIKYNVLRQDETACRMIVIHGFETSHYNEMVPNWEISEFLSQIERMFNVTFVCDNATRAVSIYRISDYYADIAQTVVIDDSQILHGDKAINRKYNLTEPFFMDYKSVEYKFPSEWKYKYADLPNDVREACTVLEFDTYNDFDIKEYKSDDYFNKPYIFRAKDIQTDFILVDYERVKGSGYHYEPVDIFRGIISEEKPTTLKIAPAEVISLDLHPNINGYKLMGAPIAYARNQETIDLNKDSAAKNGLLQWIEQGMPGKTDTTNNTLYVAYHMGWNNVLHGESSDENLNAIYDNTFYPFCVTYPYIMQCYELGDQGDIYKLRRCLKRDDYDQFTFNLGYLTKTRLSGNIPIDHTTEFEINFTFNGVRPDVRSKFIIGNRLYFCKEITYYIEKGEFRPYCKGLFYPAT